MRNGIPWCGALPCWCPVLAADDRPDKQAGASIVDVVSSQFQAIRVFTQSSWAYGMLPSSSRFVTFWRAALLSQMWSGGARVLHNNMSIQTHFVHVHTRSYWLKLSYSPYFCEWEPSWSINLRGRFDKQLMHWGFGNWRATTKNQADAVVGLQHIWAVVQRLVYSLIFASYWLIRGAPSTTDKYDNPKSPKSYTPLWESALLNIPKEKPIASVLIAMFTFQD